MSFEYSEGWIDPSKEDHYPVNRRLVPQELQSDQDTTIIPQHRFPIFGTERRKVNRNTPFAVALLKR